MEKNETKNVEMLSQTSDLPNYPTTINEVEPKSDNNNIVTPSPDFDTLEIDDNLMSFARMWNVERYLRNLSSFTFKD